MIMKAIYKYITAVGAAMLLSFAGMSVSAQTLPSLVLGQDPAALAVGMVGCASDAGAYAVQNNVAAISLSEETLDAQIGMGLWQPEYADYKTFGIAAMYRLGRLGVALDSRMLRMPAYVGVSDNGSEIRDAEFAPSELSISAGASYAVMNCLSVGLALRYADSKLAEDASSAVFGADVALYFKKNGIKAGLSVNNLGTKVKFLDRAYSQPMMAKLGAGYDLTLGKSALDFMAEVDVLFSGSLMAGAGCEYSFNEMVYVRAGYHYGSSVDVVPSYASAGVGVSVFGAKLNFAYLFGSKTLGNSMCFSLGYSF